MPTNRPTSVELLSAIREFLKDDVLGRLDGNEAYHLRVALNAMTILERELSDGADLDAAEKARLQALLSEEGSREALNHLLCTRIRARQLTYRDAEVMDHLVRTTMGKISIDNPKYATYLRMLETGGGN